MEYKIVFDCFPSHFLITKITRKHTTQTQTFSYLQISLILFQVIKILRLLFIPVYNWLKHDFLHVFSLCLNIPTNYIINFRYSIRNSVCFMICQIMKSLKDIALIKQENNKAFANLDSMQININWIFW